MLIRSGSGKGRKPGAVKAVTPEEAVALREKGLTQDQIARTVGVSVSSVVRYLRRAESPT